MWQRSAPASSQTISHGKTSVKLEVCARSHTIVFRSNKTFTEKGTFLNPRRGTYRILGHSVILEVTTLGDQSVSEIRKQYRGNVPVTFTEKATLSSDGKTLTLISQIGRLDTELEPFKLFRRGGHIRIQ